MTRLLTLYKEAKSPIEIIYISKSGSITQRKILIMKVNIECITAYCYLRGTKRTFLLKNILSFKPLRKGFDERVM